MPTKDPNAIRKAVSSDYAQAVTQPGVRGCCGPVPIALTGYTISQIDGVPGDAVAHSFGCGNPVAVSEMQPGQVVLDLGSGAGIDVILAARKVGETGRVIGVDMTDAMLAKARENAAAAGLSNVEFRKGIIEDLPVEDASVDWVISNCVINLSPEKHKVFAEIARVLTPGGTVLVSDIVAEELPADAATQQHLYSSCLAGAIPEADYLQGMRDAGLTEVTVVDKVVYTAEQIALLLGEGGQEGGCCSSDTGCCGTQTEGDVDVSYWADRLADKVASIKVRAIKPRA